MATTHPIATDRLDKKDMVAQYFADTTAAQDDTSKMLMGEKLRTYAMETLEYLAVGGILQLRRQATAALHYMEGTKT